MNTLIDQLVKDCIYEMQNIPYYHGKNGPETLSWFDEEELEDIFELAKYLVYQYLTTKNIIWILEKVAFADDVEKAIIICMAVECLLRIIDAKRRTEKTSKDNRFEGLLTQEIVDKFKELSQDYSKLSKQLLEGILVKAEQFPGKPIANQPQ